MPTTSDDDQTTVRLARPPSRQAPNTTEEDEPETRRRRTEGVALVFGTLLAGSLLTALFTWLRDEHVPKEQTMQFVFMTLTSGAVVGIFLSAVLAISRRVTNDVRRTIRQEHAALRVVAEENTERGMAILRSVAFSINDNRIEFEKGVRRIFSLVSDALERGGMASAEDLAALREQVETLQAKANEAVTGYAAGWVDAAIAQQFGMAVGYDAEHPHLRLIKEEGPTGHDGPHRPPGRKP